MVNLLTNKFIIQSLNDRYNHRLQKEHRNLAFIKN